MIRSFNWPPRSHDKRPSSQYESLTTATSPAGNCTSMLRYASTSCSRPRKSKCCAPQQVSKRPALPLHSIGWPAGFLPGYPCRESSINAPPRLNPPTPLKTRRESKSCSLYGNSDMVPDFLNPSAITCFIDRDSVATVLGYIPGPAAFPSSWSTSNNLGRCFQSSQHVTGRHHVAFWYRFDADRQETLMAFSDLLPSRLVEKRS